MMSSAIWWRTRPLLSLGEKAVALAGERRSHRLESNINDAGRSFGSRRPTRLPDPKSARSKTRVSVSELQNSNSCSEVIARLRTLADPSELAGMAWFGIGVENTLGGIRVPVLRRLARKISRNHRLAQELWKSGIHEARHLAAMIDEPARVTEAQLERWARDFDSWDVCDGCCLNLFAKTPFAFRKALQWSRRKEEFVKRAAFSLVAVLAVHDRDLTDERFEKLLSVIKRESGDPRNFVKKGVNWALRQIGKRNLRLNAAAIKTARKIRGIDSTSARWIASDALRELKSETVDRRLRQKHGP